MNQTALVAALNPLNQQAHLRLAFHKTAILKQSVAHLNNKRGQAFLAIRWSVLGGFVITDKNGNNVTKQVFSIIRKG